MNSFLDCSTLVIKRNALCVTLKLPLLSSKRLCFPRGSKLSYSPEIWINSPGVLIILVHLNSPPHSLNKWDHSVYVCNCSPTSQNHKQRKLYYLWFLPGNWDKNNLVHNPFNLAQGLWHCDSHGSCTMEVRTRHGVVHELKEFMFLISKKRRHFKIHLPCARSV